MDDERKRKVLVDPDLTEDPNYTAYKAQEAELKANHMGKWVAFADGQLVLPESDQDALLQKISEGYADKPVFIKEIVAIERVIHFRSPRRVR